MDKPKIVTMTKQDLLKYYPANAFFDVKDESINIPDKDTLWNTVYLHELTHWNRRHKWSLKFSDFKYLLLSLAALFVGMFLEYVGYSLKLIFIVPMSLWIVNYYYEEVLVQKKAFKKWVKEGGEMFESTIRD